MRSTAHNTALIALSVVIVSVLYVASKNLTILSMKNNASRMLATVHPGEYLALLAQNERVVLDVRTAKEYDEGHIAGSKNLDFYSQTFADELDALDKHTPYLIYCRSGNRSGQTLALMESLGFTNVIDLEGGVLAWESGGNSLCVNC